MNEVIGFVGLGRMGLPMASRLVATGYEVSGADPQTEARDAFIAAGGRSLATAAHIADVASTVILMLPSSAVVASVLEGGLLDRLSPGSTLIDMSSSEPLETQRIGALAASNGLQMIDAPVSGGVKGALAGTLTIMAGGEPHDVERCQPLFEAMGKRALHVGPLGAGHALKALNNLLSATALLSASEGLRVAQRFGLDPALFVEAINGSSGRSNATEYKLPSFVLPGTFDAGFALSLMVKDMRIAVALAESLGERSELSHRALELWERAAGELSADADHTEIARWIAAQSDQG